MKRKIGTLVDDSLYNDVRLLAARERRRIGEVVEVALSDYVERSKRKNRLQSGLARFLEAPGFNLSDKQFRESLELDFFER